MKECGRSSEIWYFVILTLLFIVQSGSATAFQFLPDGHLYDPYLASSRTQTLKFGQISVSDEDIKNTGSSRWDLQAGDRVGVLRWDRNWQFSVFGGFNALFDIDNSTDNIGWDGRFGASITSRLSVNQGLKIEFRHQSAHIGDELIERTGRKRIDYTRQEYNLGYSYLPSESIRLYVEPGWGWDLRNPALQEAWRIQSGFEYGIPRQASEIERANWGPFFAADFESMEERDWEIDSTLQVGLYTLRGNKLWRLGIEYRNGRPPLGEFFRNDESYFELAVWRIGL